MDSTHIVYDDLLDEVTFGDDGPEPRMLANEHDYRSVLVGLRAGQAIPEHPSTVSTFHILSGTGTMRVAEDTVELSPGVTVVAGQGVSRGITADTDLVFLGSQRLDDIYEDEH